MGFCCCSCWKSFIWITLTNVFTLFLVHVTCLLFPPEFSSFWFRKYFHTISILHLNPWRSISGTFYIHSFTMYQSSISKDSVKVPTLRVVLRLILSGLEKIRCAIVFHSNTQRVFFTWYTLLHHIKKISTTEGSFPRHAYTFPPENRSIKPQNATPPSPKIPPKPNIPQKTTNQSNQPK